MLLPKLDLRLRIAVVLAAVCIAVVGALGITLYLASKDMEEALVEELTLEEMESLIERSRATRAPVFASGPNLQDDILTTLEDHAKLPERLRGLGPGQHQVDTGPRQLYALVRDLAGTRYMVVYDKGQHNMREERFRNFVWVTLAMAAVIAVLLGYWLAGMLTRQLTELASRVTVLSPDEPHPPLERDDHDREVAALAHALDAYHTRMLDMMLREQEFTANASHELRTPLTAIRTSCELLESDASLTEKARSRVGMIGDAARQMTERIEALLYLARQRGPVALETVNLKRCVEDAASPYRDEIDRKGLALDVRVDDSESIQLDRKALQLVLANLIKNAVRYTERGYVRITYEPRRLTVSDSGAGITPEHLPQLFERYYRAGDKADGLGLGLAIVRRVCDDLGWKVQVQSQPGAGSAFTVFFA